MKRFKSILIGMLAIAFIGTVISCSEEAEANEATIENRVAELESWTSSLPKITGSIQYDMAMFEGVALSMKVIFPGNVYR